MKRKILMVAAAIVIILIVIILLKYNMARNKAIDNFKTCQDKAKTIKTSYGKISYIDKGKGEVILSCHGICGGYDQAYDSLSDKTNAYRVIAPSRFGYPERTKGLILYCSGYPAFKKPQKKATYDGPPSAICYDFPMWAVSPLFKPIMGLDSSTIEKIMPLSQRHNGIVLDAKIANTDMDNQYKKYDMRKLKVPALIVHAEDDKLADYNKAKLWSKKIPNCTFVSLKTGGHLMVGNSNEISQAFNKFTAKK